MPRAWWLALLLLSACRDCSAPPPPNCGPCKVIGQVVSCLDRCVTPLELHADCTPFGFCPTPCADGLSCSYMNGPWRCEARNLTLTQSCRTGNTDDRCADGNYCRDGARCHSKFGSLCAAPVREGAACDSNIDAPGCSPCARGLQCNHEDSPLPGGIGERTRDVCRKPCGPDQPCACVDGSDCSSTAGATRCCVERSHVCIEDSDCCDPSARCVVSKDGKSTVCDSCHAGGTACIVDHDCCNGSCKSGSCACGPNGEPCEPGGGTSVGGGTGTTGGGNTGGGTGGTTGGTTGSGGDSCGKYPKDCGQKSDPPCCPGFVCMGGTCNCLLNDKPCGAGAPCCAGNGLACGYVAGSGTVCTTCLKVGQGCFFGAKNYSACCADSECAWSVNQPSPTCQSGIPANCVDPTFRCHFLNPDGTTFDRNCCDDNVPNGTACPASGTCGDGS